MKRELSPVVKPGNTVAYVLAVLLLFGIAFALFFINLENQVVVAFDEARHGVSGYEMIRNNDYLVHTYQGETDYWNLKPPLSFWLIALHFRLFGYSVVAFRLHSVIATCLAMLMVTLWTKRRYGTAASLITLAFIVVNSALYNVNFARTGEADALHTLFVTLSMLCLLNSSRDFRWLYGSALGFGFSFMAKGFHAAIIPMMCLFHLICTGNIRKLRLKNCLLLLLFGLLPVLPWAAARYFRDGFTFLTQMFTTDVQARVTAEVSENQGSWLFYLRHLSNNRVVIVYGLLCILAFLWRWFGAKKRRLNEAHIGMLIFILFPIVFYSFSSSKLYHYIVPVMIPLSIAGGFSALYIIRQVKGKGWKAALCVLLAAGIAWQGIALTRAMLGRDDKGSLQTTLAEALNRDFDSERHMYIEYLEDRTRWMQNDMLVALLFGDVICKDGGTDAFVEDEESALLIVHKDRFDWALMEYYPVYYESTYYFVMEN